MAAMTMPDGSTWDPLTGEVTNPMEEMLAKYGYSMFTQGPGKSVVAPIQWNQQGRGAAPNQAGLMADPLWAKLQAGGVRLAGAQDLTDLANPTGPGNGEGGSDLANIMGVLGFVGGGAALTGGLGAGASTLGADTAAFEAGGAGGLQSWGGQSLPNLAQMDGMFPGLGQGVQVAGDANGIGNISSMGLQNPWGATNAAGNAVNYSSFFGPAGDTPWYENLMNAPGIGGVDVATGALDAAAPFGGAATGMNGWDAILNGAQGSGVLSGGGGGASEWLYNNLGLNTANMGVSNAAKALLGGGSTSGAALGALLGSMNGAKPAGNTTTTQDIPDWLKPYATNLLNTGQGIVNNSPPADYSGSDAMLKSMMGMTANPYSGQSNPYFEDTLNKSLSDTQGRVNAQFGNGNAFGNSANQELLATNLGNQSNQMRFGQYQNQQNLWQQDANRATNIAQGMPNYNTAKTSANFAPLTAQKGLFTSGTQTTQPYFTNPTAGALSGGLLGSQLFGGK